MSMLDITQLNNLRALSHETEFVEFKVNNLDPNKVGEILSALSNSANICNEPSGYLIFGVKDDTHNVVGTTINPKTKKIGGEDFEHWINKMLCPSVNLRIYSLDVDGKTVWVFEVPACYDRPLRFKNNAYIRVGSYTKKLSEYPDKERLIWNNSKNRCFEKNVAKDDLSAPDAIALLDYTRYFELTKQPLPANIDGIIDRLLQENSLQRSGSKYAITNLGAVLFAKDLTQFEHLRRKAVRVVQYEGKHRAVESSREKEGKLGYAIGYKGLVSFVNDRLPANEEIKQAFRVEKRMYPEIAIRELIANALIHQDFSEQGTGPLIEIFSDRIEISNPGTPLINVDRFIDHKPKSRNEALAAFMRRIGVCEERGSGIDKVVFEVEVYQLPAPRFEAHKQYTQVTLFAYQKLSNMSREDKLRACYQHCCLRHVSNEVMTNSSLRKRFKLPDSKTATVTVSNIISDAVKAGLVKPLDPDSQARKLAKYVPYWA